MNSHLDQANIINLDYDLVLLNLNVLQYVTETSKYVKKKENYFKWYIEYINEEINFIIKYQFTV